MRGMRVPVLLCLTACNSILGIGEIRAVGSDGGPTDTNELPDTPPGQLADVQGSNADVFHVTGTTTMLRPQSLTTTTLQAYVPDDSAGGFHILDVTGKADGTFTIPGVPAGRYMLLVLSPGDPVPHFYQTSARTLDLGNTRLGRPDAETVAQSTITTVQLDGMTAGQSGDSIAIGSFGVAKNTFAGVTTGATTLDTTVDWQADARIDASKGDRLFVVHLQSDDSVPDQNRQAIVDAFSTDLTVVDGQAASVTGTFLHPATASLFVHPDPASFVQGLDVPSHFPIDIVARLRSSQYGGASLGVSTATYSRTFRGLTGSGQDEVVYHDPFPDDLPRSILTSASLSWRYVSRGSPSVLEYDSVAFDRVEADSVVQVSAKLAPPHAIMVGGVDASQATAVPYDGVHPVTVAWAPTVGVTHYQVSALRLGDDGSTPIIATFDTPIPGVTMPGSLFQIGGSYVLSVLAILDPTTDFAGGVVRRVGFPNSEREAVTARLLFAASCGDGVANAAYEQCDSSGVATASCNADCSAPRCGDAIYNSAIKAEACDDGSNSLVCNADCTVASCGDGKLNGVRGEQCDLGADNGGAGKCCSATCTLVPPAMTCPGP